MWHSRWYKVVCIALLLPLGVSAQEQLPLNVYAQEGKGKTTKSSQTPEKAEKSKRKVFTGFSGGMLLHMGYGFSENPSELFRNETLKKENLKNLPKNGIFLGIGGQLRIHLFNHMRIGGEGYVSTMPLKKVGNVRSGWGGLTVDGYTTWGKVKPFIGAGIGGGAMYRTYVNHLVNASNTEDENDNIVYNASVTKTPFFYLDPQLGLEFGLTKRINLIVRLDYMLPFSAKGEGIRDQLTNVGEQMKDWKGLMTPTGPRLYVGFMFNH